MKLVENDPKSLLVNIIFGKNEDKSNDITLEHFQSQVNRPYLGLWEAFNCIKLIGRNDHI